VAATAVKAELQKIPRLTVVFIAATHTPEFTLPTLHYRRRICLDGATRFQCVLVGLSTLRVWVLSDQPIVEKMVLGVILGILREINPEI
jgi:hypothetical protein